MAESRAKGCVRSRAWNRARWLELVRAWSGSALPVVEYCRREGLHPSSFQRWRHIFGESGEALLDADSSAEDASAGALFAQVEVTSSAAALDAQSIELVLAGERRVRVGRNFDEETLRRLVRTLEGLAC